MRELKRPAGERGARARGDARGNFSQEERLVSCMGGRQAARPLHPAPRRGSRAGRGSRAPEAGRLRIGDSVGCRQLHHGGPQSSWRVMALSIWLALWGGWPPLYPAMLAGGGLFGLDPYAVAGPLNAVIFGLTVLVAGSWLRRRLHSRFLWLWGCFSNRARPSARRSGVPSHERVGFHSVRSARADADRRPLERRWTRRPDPGGRVQCAGLPDPLPGRFRDSGGGPDTARSAGCAAGEDEAHRRLYADCRGPGGSVDTADLSGCRINDRRKRQGFLLISLPRGRGSAHRRRGRVARRVDRPGPVGARDGRLPCVLPSLGSEKGRSCCFGCCLGSVARIRRFSRSPT